MTAPETKAENLEAAWSWLPPSSDPGSVQQVVVRLGEGEYEHPERVRVTVEGGIEGDRWRHGAADPDAAVSLMCWSTATLIAHEAGAHWSGVGDNLLVDFDLSVEHLPVGTRLRVGDVLLEVSPKPHLGCAKFQARFGKGALAWVNDKETRDRRLRGVHTKVLEGGTIRRGDAIEVV